jgi:TctA family transporter|tara:strand:- start:501 stop:842 length:342 start_codon:yes stop_codon:yes gene_type:complete
MANSFVNKKVDLTTTSATTLYTVPSATTAVIKSILVSEDTGNADTITISLTNTSSAVFSLFKTKAIGANATVELLTAPLVVEESEIIKVTAATANRLHVVLSALEIKPRQVTT